MLEGAWDESQQSGAPPTNFLPKLSPKCENVSRPTRHLRSSLVGNCSRRYQLPPTPNWLCHQSWRHGSTFRAAARVSFALWGGRFNPIIVFDKPQEAQSLIDVFRVDVILPPGDSEQVKEFPKQFPHIITPFFPGSIFVGDANHGGQSEVLDVQNALVHFQHKPEWKRVKEHGLRLYGWANDDPLADVFLTHFGEFPSADEIHIDYRRFLREVSAAKEVAIGRWRSALRFLNSPIGGSKLSFSLGVRDGTGFYHFLCPGFDRRRTVGRPGLVSHPATQCLPIPLAILAETTNQ